MKMDLLKDRHLFGKAEKLIKLMVSFDQMAK